MMRLRGWWWLAVMVMTGCASRGPGVWRVEGRTLAPPKTVSRVAVQEKGVCSCSAAIAARRRRGGSWLTVNGAELGKQQPGWLAGWTLRAEDAGCVRQEDAAAVETRIADAAPLPLGMRYRLRHPDHARAGFVDLGPAHRLEVITPKMREGGSGVGEIARVTESAGGLAVDVKSSPELIGVETAWYQIRDGRLFGDRRARYWRLVYKSDQRSSLVAADSLQELEAGTAALLRGEESCAWCVGVPRAVAVNPYVAVEVNGAEVRVAPGSTLGRLVREVMPTLSIEKMYEGRMTPVEFDRTKPDVLDLVLEGDERVKW